MHRKVGGDYGGYNDDTPEDDGEGDPPDGEENDSDDGGGDSEDEDDEDIVSGYEDFDWDNLDMKDTSTWPSLPSGGTYGFSGTYTIGDPSRIGPRNLGEKSIWDANGGEWRPEKPAEYSNGVKKPGHWNHKPYTRSGKHRWINVDSSGEEIEGI